MYKLLIVDDEEIEREGMAEFIPWPEYGIDLIGTASNGVEALEKIHTHKPDIVLTDVKMPVMDGIELIGRTQADCPEIQFIVLSGYGEFEFTSRAMAAGVRHYILKPCDEEKISGVIELVKQEIDQLRQHETRQLSYKKTVNKLLPKAKAQILRNMLRSWEQPEADYQLFLAELKNKEPQVFLLALQSEQGFDYLEYFVLENVLNELLEEERILAATSIQNQLLFLLDADLRDEIDQAMSRVRQEFKRFTPTPFAAAVSETGRLNEVSGMYQAVLELLRMGGGEAPDVLLQYALFQEQKNDVMQLFDFQRVMESETYNEVLFECYLTFMKMRLLKYSFSRKKQFCEFIVKVLYGEEARKPISGTDEWELMIALAGVVARKRNLIVENNKGMKRVNAIYQAVYQNISNPDLSIQFLAKEVLFMNEDHFGRLFYKHTNEKFSAFLLRQRVELAKRILQTTIEIKISELGEQLGFAPDGQYFSKVFRKVAGMSPKEYKEQIRRDSEV